MDREDVTEPHTRHLAHVFLNDVEIHSFCIVGRFGLIDGKPLVSVIQKQDVFIADCLHIFDFVVVLSNLFFQIFAALL